MAEVLRHYGYRIDRIPNVNYAGMEIDIEGRAIATDVPLYAECKCYDTEVDSPKLQQFFGKYMARWRKDKRCQGLFIALPGVNSYAKGFYRENWEKDPEVTVCLYEEERVLEAILGTDSVATPDVISRVITKDLGTPGDWLVLYTDKGLFWVQYVIPLGAGIPSRIALFDAMGKPLSDRPTVDYLAQLYPELDDFDKVVVGDPVALQLLSVPQDLEEIVEVKGSSECFEYQFPAAPEYFVGRQAVLEELDSLVIKVVNKETSSRGILFEANSGWGKSSVVLASVARLKEMGHFAVAVDSRSASSSRFILRVVDYALRKFGDFGDLISEGDKPKAISGFEGAVKAILNIGQVLERNGKLMFVFLDQFENIFFLRDVLKRIRDLFLKVCDSQTNVILGFSWKTDLIGLTDEFPYQLRDAIRGSSKRILLDTFSEVETNALLDRLADELHASLRKDLRFFLSEFSQGYPWLLKKLCAHVKAQRDAGVPQSDIAKSLLHVEELFLEDLRGLSAEEEEVLRRIAKAAPVSIFELGEESNPELVQSLVNSRLVVRIGNKYDVYWDIFRDYLNSGRLPVQENYTLRAHVRSVLSATKLLIEAGGALDVSRFQEQAGLSAQKSFYNVARDMGLLGLAKVDNGKVTLQIKLPAEAKDFEASLRDHLRDRLRRNRLIWRLSEALEEKGTLTVHEVSDLLEGACPYISATRQTWLTYARIFAGWMDAGDLAVLNKKDWMLTRYEPGTEIRERHLLLAKRRGATTPRIQYSPVEDVVVRLVEALQKDGRVNWTGLRRSTIFKALATLEDLGFIIRRATSITVLPEAREFVLAPEKRLALFAEAALKIESFATFISIVKAHKHAGLTVAELGIELREKLAVDWKDGTAETNAKIMLNWARHAKLAPGVFAVTGKGRRKGWKEKRTGQMRLFPNIEKECGG